MSSDEKPSGQKSLTSCKEILISAPWLRQNKIHTLGSPICNLSQLRLNLSNDRTIFSFLPIVFVSVLRVNRHMYMTAYETTINKM